MMAATANINHQPPNSAAVTTIAAASNSPSSPAKAAPPPWSQIVRGFEPEPDPIVNANSSENVVAVALESGGDINAAAAALVVSKKPAWNRKTVSASNSTPMNVGGGESGGGTVVMGAEQWPSLSECTTKATPKISSEFTVSVTDFGSTQVIDTSSGTKVLSPVRSPASVSHKVATSNSNHHSTSNHARPARQKSFKRDNGSNPQANGVLSHQSSQPAGEGAHYHHKHDSPKPTSGGSVENSGRDNVQNHSNRDPGQRNASGEHPHHRNPFRKGNGGPHSRGDGSHQNYGGRRNDQERGGNHDLNHQRSFNGRDASMQPRGVPRGFVRPSPLPAPFVYPPPMQPFMNPIVPFYVGPGMQLYPPIPPIFFPVPGSELYSELMMQIEFYFSNDNLVRDTYLRSKMDENGWVSVDVISEFKKVKKLTNDNHQILEAVRPSAVVEVQGDQMRRRDDWRRWVLPPSVQFPISSGSQSPKTPTVSAVNDGIQSVLLDEKSNYPTKSQASGDSSSASKISVDEANPSGC